MLNVLHLRTVTGRGGGPEKTLLNSPRFIGADYNLLLAYVRPVNDPLYDMPQRASRLNVPLVDIPERGPLDPRAIARLRKIIRDFRPHLLHAHDYKTNLLAVLFGRMMRVPVMTTLHGYVTRTALLGAYYRIDRWSLRRMDHIVAVSEDLYEFSLGLGISAKRCSFVENGIDTSEFRRRDPVDVAKRRLGFDHERLLIGAVGRLSAEKGFDLLIQAVDRLIRGGANVELAIAGEGDDRPRLAALIAELGQQHRIRLLGYRADTIDLYQAMDLYCLSSLREGLPNVVLEAMACEVPVLATRVAGIPRLLDDGVNGLVVTPGDADGLTAGLSRLVADAPLRSRLAAAARKTIEDRYSFELRMQKIRGIYDDLLGR